MLTAHSDKKKVYVFDIESDGLYDTISTVWCMYIQDVETGEKWGYRPHEILLGLEKLNEADVVVGHNVIDFDLCALKKVYPSLKDFSVCDTLCLSRFLEPDRLGGHSLKAWGERLKDEKGSYGEDTEAAWDKFSEEMFEYCEQDVSLTTKLYVHLCRVAGFDELDPPTINWIFD